jgi:hypothetical protein
MTKMAAHQVFGGHASDGQVVVGNQREDAIEPISEQFNGGNSRLAQPFGARAFLDVSQDAIAAPILRTPFGIAAVGQRIDEQRPGPVGFDVFSDAAHDAAAMAAELVDAKSHVG